MWAKVSYYCVKLAAQIEEERKAKAFSSSFSGFSLSMPVPLHNSSYSFYNAVVSTIASSIDACHVTYVASSTIALVKPFISPVIFQVNRAGRGSVSILDRLGVSPRMRCEQNSKGFGLLVPTRVHPVIVALHQIIPNKILLIRIIVFLRGITRLRPSI